LQVTSIGLDKWDADDGSKTQPHARVLLALIDKRPGIVREELAGD
jgi:hypothetical protein